MARGSSVLLLLGALVVCQGLTPASYFTPVDQARMRSLFQEARPYGTNLENLHYSVMGFNLLGGGMDLPGDACKDLQAAVDTSDVESLFYASSATANLKSMKHECKLSAGDAGKVLTAAITGEASTLTIYQAVAALKNLGLPVDSAKVTTALTAALKTDDAPLSHGYAFHAASYLTGDLKTIFDLIEDIVAQADEVDEQFLQFEGGLYTTAVVVDGAYKLAAAVKKAPTISEDKVIKFTNYFLSRKHIQSLQNGATVLSAVKTLTTNQYHIPIAVTLASQVSVSDKYPIVQVRISNLLGQSLGKLTVTADTARHMGDDAVVLSKKPFAATTVDPSLYELDFLKVRPARGFYKISISIVPQKADARLLGTSGAEVEVKVTTQAAIENVEIGIGDKEQSAAAKIIKVQHPSKAANVLEADFHQKVTMKFQLRDKTSNAVMVAHQTFVRLTNQKSKQEIIFVAEADATSTFKFDLDVGASAKDFNYKSGKYTMDVIVGDAVIQNPFSWTVADINLSFQDGSEKEEDVDRYSKKPEIKHMFREPEKRPPTAVSNVFTGLVCLPILLLLGLWMKIGANMSNFPMSLSAVGFHLGLGAIFGLYYMYWTHLNMFTTIRYLGIVGVPTFLFGNRLLSGIAARRK